jgi:hypothetical protein
MGNVDVRVTVNCNSFAWFGCAICIPLPFLDFFHFIGHFGEVARVAIGM